MQRAAVVAAVAMMTLALAGCAGSGAAARDHLSESSVLPVDPPALGSPTPGPVDPVPPVVLSTPPPPRSPAAGPTSVTDLDLPTGPGQLLPATADPAKVAADLAAAGLTVDDLWQQESWIDDVGTSEHPFVAAADLEIGPTAQQLSGAAVLRDNLVVAVFSGNTCTRTVGGYAYATADSTVVVVHAGQDADQVCNDSAELYRLTLWVPGARAGGPVESVGGTAPSEGAIAPMMELLPDIVLLPGDFPFHDG